MKVIKISYLDLFDKKCECYLSSLSQGKHNLLATLVPLHSTPLSHSLSRSLEQA